MTVTGKCCKIFPFFGGLFLISVGIYCILMEPQDTLIRYLSAKEAELVEGGLLYERVWVNMDSYFRVYLFNVMNPNDVMEGELPILEERGPYVYNLNVKKKILRIDEEADEIEFEIVRTMTFNPQLSKGSEDDELTLINSGYIATIGSIQAKFAMFLTKVGNDIHKLFPGMEDIFVRGKAGDFMFRGLPMACDPVKYPELKMICGYFDGQLPEGIERTDADGVYTWSYFGTVNATAQGPFKVNRGIKNKTQLGDITSFGGKRVQKIWSNECNKVRGTDSITWPPMQTKSDFLYTFESQICRSAIVDFKKEDILNGLVGWRYELSQRSWEPDRFDCYCPMKRKIAICPIKGVMDLTPCKGAPLYYSEPHFLHGDPELLDFAKGLNPNEEIHRTFITFEPYTGAPLAGAKKMQLSVKLFKSPIVTMIANVSEGFFPILWVSESADSSVEMFAEIIQCHRLLRLLRYLTFVPVIIGIFIIIKAIVLFNVSNLDTIIEPKIWKKSLPKRNTVANKDERPANGRPRARFNQLYD